MEHGEYNAAQEKYQKSLEISQQIGGEAGEASAWRQLATIDMEHGDYDPAQEKFQKSLGISQQIGDEAGEATAWYQLASIDMERGNYDPAQEKFQKLLEIDQQTGNKTSEAYDWHALATIDMERGDCNPAQKKLKNALEIEQQIGDKAGEAMTCAQIGIIAAMEGRVEEGLRLVALSSMILDEIEHDDLKQAVLWIDRLASELGYSPDRLEAMCGAVAEAYQQNRGQDLVEAALSTR